MSVTPSAICAGGINAKPHLATVTATVTDESGEPLGGRTVTFSTDHEFVNVSPIPGPGTPTNGVQGHAPVTATTDAYGKAQITLISGDGAVSGHVIASVGGAQEKADVDFQVPNMSDVRVVDPDNPEQEVDRWPVDGASQVLIILHEKTPDTSDPVPQHLIEWTFRFWAVTKNPYSSPPDYEGDGAGTSLGTIVRDPDHPSPTTDTNGASYALFTTGTTPGWFWFVATDRTVFTKIQSN